MNILALDVGTSSVKAAVLDVETTTPVGPIGRAEYALDFPTPEAAEVQPERLWQAVTTAARAATRAVPDVQGVGLAVLTPSLVLIGKDDKPLGPIWTHLDRRSRMIARDIWSTVGEEFLATTGNRPLPGGMTVTSYRQQLLADPYLAHHVRRYLHVNGWLALRMTGETAFDPANACFTGFFGTVTDQKWSERWCNHFEIDPTWLPPVLCGTTTIGTLRPEVATELGLPAGVPVKLGTADTSSGILACRMKPGDLMHTVGTTQVVAVFAENPAPSPAKLTRLLGVGKQFLQVTHNPVGGVAFDWLRNLCFREQSEEEFFSRTVPAARGRSTRVSLDPPFLGGDRLEIEAHRAAFRDLTLSTDRMDLLAALLEALVRKHREALGALGQGTRFNRVFLTGGGAELVRTLISEYADANIVIVLDGALRGIARLFQSPV